MTEYLEICFKKIREVDVELEAALVNELGRQQDVIELIASENLASESVMAMMGNIFNNKYAEGYPGKRYYGGCGFVDVAESLAISRACSLFGAEFANVQPHSGAQANEAVYYAALTPGDTVMGMKLSEGGHLTHGSKANLSGRFYNFVPYGVDVDTGLINYEEVYNIALQHKPKLIVCGASAYPRKIDFKKFKEIADACGAMLMADIAHIAGLVVAGLHENPCPYADFVTTTTHKTLRGPRGALILCKEEYGQKINKAVFPGVQGGPLMHIIGAKAICLHEANSANFKKYMSQVLENAKAMANEFVNHDLKLVSGGTDNHMLLLDLRESSLTGHDLEKRLDLVNITVNKNTVPGETRPPHVASGIRIGTPVITSRQMGTVESRKIAKLIMSMCEENSDSNINATREEVKRLTELYPIYR